MRLFPQLGFGIALLAGALAAHAVDLPGPIVSTEWLAQHRDEVQVVEVRSDMASFQAQPVVGKDKKSGKPVVEEVGGHLPGSRLLDMKALRADRTIGGLTVRYMHLEPADFERVVQAAGVDGDKPLVLVPMGKEIIDIDEALYAYWQFKLHGQKQLAVLDGGAAAWLLEGRPVEVEPVAAQVGNWKAGKPAPALLAESKDAAGGRAQLVDARPPAQFYGLSKRDYVFDYGHIKGAYNLAPELLTRNAQGVAYFHSSKTYGSLMQLVGISPVRPAISYCNSGHFAAGPWFILSEVLGNPRTRLYDGSLHEWTLEKRPLVSVQQ